MKKIFLRSWSILLVLGMLMSMTACEPTDEIVIECSNAATGTLVKDLTVAVTHGDTVLPHSFTWYVARGDDLHQMTPEETLGVGYYELHVIYLMPEGHSEALPVVAKCGTGELIKTEQQSDGSYRAVIRFYFEGEAEPEQSYPITINCTNAASGTPLADIQISVLYGTTTLTHTATWHVAKGDELHEMKPGDSLGVGYYELSITYTMPAGVTEAVPVITNCGTGELIKTEKQADGRYLAVIRFYFADTAEPTDPPKTTDPTEPEQPHLITINCQNAQSGIMIANIQVSVFYGNTQLAHSATWRVARGDSLYDMSPSDSLGAGYYELSITYTMPAGITEPAPVIANCGAGALQNTQKLADGSYLAVIGFYFTPAECNHSWRNVTAPAGDCTQGLEYLVKCDICGEERTEKLPAQDHNFDPYQTVIVLPTCVDDGSKTYVCGVCSTTVVEVTPATGIHTYTDIGRSGSCDTVLEIYYKCVFCSDQIVQRVGPMPHNYSIAQPYNNTNHMLICSNCNASCLEPHTLSGNVCTICGSAIINAIPGDPRAAQKRLLARIKAGCLEEQAYD